LTFGARRPHGSSGGKSDRQGRSRRVGWRVHRIVGQPDAIHVVGFTTYNTAKAIPTSLQLPCSGKGTVTFTTCFGTVPCAANARNDVVPVTFENLAV
jgi:hypothetical protein